MPINNNNNQQNDNAVNNDNNVNLVNDANDAVNEEIMDNFSQNFMYITMDTNLADRTRREISNIIHNAGVNYADTVNDITRYNIELIETIPEVLRENTVGDLSLYIFTQAYDCLENGGFDSLSRIKAAQGITNVLMNNYSPVAFADGTMDIYANNYVFSREDAFTNWLHAQGFEENDINSILQSVRENPALADNAVNLEARHEDFIRDRDEELRQRAAQYAGYADTIQQIDELRDEWEKIQRNNLYMEEREEIARENNANPAQNENIENPPQPENLVNNAPNQEQQVNPPVNGENAQNQVQAEAQEKTHEDYLREREEELKRLVRSQNIRPDEHEYRELNPDEKSIRAPENSDMFVNKLKTYNVMYGTKINVNVFAGYVSDAWENLNSTDESKRKEGKEKLSTLFRATLKHTFDVERRAAYNEQRLPEFTEIIKGANELLRVSMFAFTDLYHNPDKAKLFVSTAFGGLREDEMAELTMGDSFWKLDQRSNSAWKIQSEAAKNIADQWLKEEKPYETMIEEMSALVEANKEKITDEKDVYNKLAAAEWLLLNNEKMMVDNPEDPLNKVPNWGNRYWKAITSAREKLGIPKHISMRELIQGNYAEMAKAVSNQSYNKKQIEEQVLDPNQRKNFDSMEKQRVEFTVQRQSFKAVNSSNEKKIQELEMTSFRVRLNVKECDEFLIQQEAPKDYGLAIAKTNELEFKTEAPQNDDNRIQRQNDDLQLEHQGNNIQIN